jgi:hypothetical protein
MATVLMNWNTADDWTLATDNTFETNLLRVAPTRPHVGQCGRMQSAFVSASPSVSSTFTIDPSGSRSNLSAEVMMRIDEMTINDATPGPFIIRGRDASSTDLGIVANTRVGPGVFVEDTAGGNFELDHFFGHWVLYRIMCTATELGNGEVLQQVNMEMYAAQGSRLLPIGVVPITVTDTNTAKFDRLEIGFTELDLIANDSYDLLFDYIHVQNTGNNGLVSAGSPDWRRTWPVS